MYLGNATFMNRIEWEQAILFDLGEIQINLVYVSWLGIQPASHMFEALLKMSLGWWNKLCDNNVIFVRMLHYIHYLYVGYLHMTLSGSCAGFWNLKCYRGVQYFCTVWTESGLEIWLWWMLPKSLNEQYIVCTRDQHVSIHCTARAKHSLTPAQPELPVCRGGKWFQ